MASSENQHSQRQNEQMQGVKDMRRKFSTPVILTGFVVMLGGIWTMIYLPSRNIQENWTRESERYVQKSNALFVLSKELGYGGLIHNYKDYVLRRDNRYLESMFASSQVVSKQIELLKKISSSKELVHVLAIEGVVHDYIEKAKWMILNQEKIMGMSIKELDKVLRIDESKALRALNHLNINTQNNKKVKTGKTVLQAEYLFRQSLSLSLFLTLIYWSLMAILKHFHRSLEKALINLKAINDLSPASICLVNESGEILEVNPQFKRVFKVPEEMNITRKKIESFVPYHLREKHEKLRLNFQNSSRTVAMNDRNTTFTAIDAKGIPFPVEIGISSMKTPYGKVSLAVIIDKTEEEHLRNRAELDHLTQVYNRRIGEEFVSKELSRQKRHDERFSVLLIDIDHFKMINDSLGHREGDRVIVNIVRIIEHSLRHSDTLFRWGGDEFLCLLPKTAKGTSEVVAQKLVEAVRSEYCENEIAPTLSIGCAESESIDTVESVIARADEALYRAKSLGKNGYSV